MMGTIVEIICQDKDAISEAFEEIKKIERIANNFDPHSEISQLNRDGRIKAGQDMLTMVKESLKIYSLSDGAFDITAAPIIDIWKTKIRQFQDKKIEPAPPTEDEIKDKLRLVGSDKITIDEKEFLITFTSAGMSIDLGAIAKGYAVDKAISRLKELGINSAMVNVGGNMYCLGKKGARKWRIGIQHPRRPQEILSSLDLENQAAATSGDYEQYFTAGKKRYSHIIDPKTGYPVDNGIVSVTVVAKDATTADGFSTATFVLGKAKAEELLKKVGNIEAKILEEKDI
jgi:thiamine biosynthesis lipoprotein